jgi:cell division protein FtsW (lipid II flippase)
MSKHGRFGVRELNPVALGGLATIVLAWLIYQRGIVVGLREFASYAYLVALFYLSISVVMALLFRQRLFGKLQYALAPLVLVYFAASLVFRWPALYFLTFVSLVGGAFVGAVSAFASPYKR